ncbi:hypothetical protein PK35_03045 [Tamlana nanhaiensis]|uniref:Glycosyl hydrolase family 95 N-terminal domain-containing protein n=1 Tax=Neotamlana nanhaiensis TaxID=1382798 RepID=A0A0D7W6T0_9FLAO|nr:hypothetical protein [Tamlana nanhaiensis]KJD34830.1 hypothetical protein PK35_03045 [Tamlana nanhaiensis]
MKKINIILLALSIVFLWSCKEKPTGTLEIADKIDRKAVATRHNVKITAIDTLGSLNVGNGKFSYTVDVTGMQSFPEFYANGVPLGTQSEWGWHTTPNTENFSHGETLKAYNFNGDKNSLYAIQNRSDERAMAAADYFRMNPHRLQLGNVGLQIVKADGSIAQPQDLKDINQELNVYTGKITSEFTVEGEKVSVVTYANFDDDGIAVKIASKLLDEGRIQLKLRFPYPTNEFADRGVNYQDSEKHETTVKASGKTFQFTRTLDDDVYYVSTTLNSNANINEVEKHYFTISPEKNNEELEVYVSFSEEKQSNPVTFSKVEANSITTWNTFWQSGGAVDFSECTDPRAFEIERRVVLSQYLTRSQCAGNFPVQETGLTYNSWYGKPHMEMYWWHAAHYALWGRTELIEQSIDWYFTAFDGAKDIAKRQGYKGVRWQKMTDHQAGEAPSNVGAFLLWQQPHVIYLAELIYRNNPTQANLEKYKTLIFETADFMASFPTYDAETDRYNLGKGVIPAQECFDKTETFNPPMELSYWKWALQKAQEWRKRLNLEPNNDWQTIIDKLVPMAEKDGVYLVAESVPNSYSETSEHTIDHPAVLGAISFLPHNNYIDLETMNKTFDVVDSVWTWHHTWGWDFPLEAMAATRLNRPEDAVKGLLRDEITNTYLPSGHNYQTPRLTLYLPGNGGVLSAVALMCAGYDGNTVENPGFPKDGKWNVKWEGLKPMP